MIQQLTALRNAGVRVALDDFGTGFSSLGRLQGLPVDTLKIDQSFISMIRTGDEKLPILSCMIAMAHGLGLTVTAEGVETAAQAEYLMKLDCDSLQGFLFSRPAPGPACSPPLTGPTPRSPPFGENGCPGSGDPGTFRWPGAGQRTGGPYDSGTHCPRRRRRNRHQHINRRFGGPVSPWELGLKNACWSRVPMPSCC